MKKKKKKPKKLSELEDEAKEFLGLMQSAAEEDLEAIKARKPATKKLAMLNKVVYMLTRKDMMRPLLDLDLAKPSRSPREVGRPRPSTPRRAALLTPRPTSCSPTPPP